MNKEQSNFKTVKRLLFYLNKYRISMIIVSVCIVLSSLASVVSSLFLQILIDSYIIPLLGVSTPVFTGLIKALTIVGFIYFIGTGATFIYNRIIVTVAQGTLKEIRYEMFGKMQKLPIQYFDTHAHGDIMSCYTNDIDTLRQMLAQSLTQIITSICTIAVVFCAMLYQSVYLTIVILFVVAAQLLVARILTGKSAFFFIKQQNTLGILDGYVEEMIHGQKIIKVFSHEEQTKKEFRQRNREWEHASSNANGYANALMPVSNSIGYLQYVIVAIIGAWMAINQIGNLTIFGMNVITLGSIVSFLTLSRNFTNPVSQVANQFNSIITALAGATRIFNLMDEEAESDEGCVTIINTIETENGEIQETKEYTGTWAWKYPHSNGTTTLSKLSGDVVFEHVDFSYSPEKKILHDITLRAKPGQKIALVGATGAGKTTITNLINRFYDIDSGKIRYDGINIEKIKKLDLRSSLGIVLQEVNLFTGTIMENLFYGNPKATDDECIKAAKLANAHNFIMMLPKGYDTILDGEGSGLSQGQRQLISIARAIVANPPVMILDEATSSIDTRTEALVQQGMDRLMEGRTVFVIAHRLSTIMNSDIIAVMDNGWITESGSHDELINKKGTYYQLYTGVFEME